MSKTADSKKQAWPFQQRVNALVTEGHNVVLQAPTGSGKTRAALEPFVLNLGRGKGKDISLPRTCRYAVPLRTLASQFHREHADLDARIDARSHADLQRHYGNLEVGFSAVQTGDSPGDPQLEAGLTFCTIDQLLAAFLALPYAVGTRKANLKVGGVVGSYLVLDEWHLYPLRALRDGGEDPTSWGARMTTLAMLRILKDYDLCRFVLMTATFSTTLVKELANLLGASLENLRQGAESNEPAEQAFARELAALNQDRQRELWRADRPMEACIDGIMDQHRDSSLIVCNTVERAQTIYQLLLDARSRHNRPDVRIVLLHSRFAAEDRQRHTKLLEDELGKEAWEARALGERPLANIIVVATQVVEVGLNISATRLHTDLAPANSLVQRAGRCARFAGQSGQVIVYPLAEEASYLPYRKQICLDTARALPCSAQDFGFGDEQKLIDEVHTPEDRKLVQAFRSDEQNIVTAIVDSLKGIREGTAATLIRDVSRLPVLIHDDPNAAITAEPWCWQAFTLHATTLRARWQRLQELAASRGCDWVCKQVRLIDMQRTPTPDVQEADSRFVTGCFWDEITNEAELNGALMVALPTSLAHYDPDFGFALIDPERFPHLSPPPPGVFGWQSQPLPMAKHARRRSLRSEQQGYLEHVSGLLAAYQHNIRDEIAWVAKRLEKELGLPSGSVDMAVRVAIACHDIGKLTIGWQEWARAWYARLVNHYGDRYAVDPRRRLLAKTDYDDVEHRELQKGLTRPWHACEGVTLSQKLIDGIFLGALEGHGIERQRIKYLVCAVRSAIARHHTSQASECKAATLAPGATEAVVQALDLVRNNLTWSYDSAALLAACQAEDLTRKLVVPRMGGEDELQTWLYFVIVRSLRLADQRADAFRSSLHSLVPSQRVD